MSDCPPPSVQPVIASARKAIQNIKAYLHQAQHCADATVTNRTADLGDIQTYWRMICACAVNGYYQYCGMGKGGGLDPPYLKLVRVPSPSTGPVSGPSQFMIIDQDGAFWLPYSYPDKEKHKGLGLPDWREIDPRGMSGGYQSVWFWYTEDSRKRDQTMQASIYAREQRTRLDNYGPHVNNTGTIDLTWQPTQLP